MTPDHLALLTVTGLAQSVGSSALPNAPVVDDSTDRRPAGERLASFRKRLAGLIWPGELVVSPGTPDPAPAGC